MALIVLTVQTLAKFRVGIEVLAVSDHSAAHVGNGQDLLLGLDFRPLRDAFDISIHRPLHLVESYSRSAVAIRCTKRGMLTLLSEVHLHL
jgi:hypothetical protein